VDIIHIVCMISILHEYPMNHGSPHTLIKPIECLREVPYNTPI
jgi:hypothetical protein